MTSTRNESRRPPPCQKEEQQNAMLSRGGMRCSAAASQGVPAKNAWRCF